MSFLKFLHYTRKYVFSVRTLCPTPAGMSTNQVLDFMIFGIITGTTNGFDCIDARGRKLKEFLDMRGFLGDHQASS